MKIFAVIMIICVMLSGVLRAESETAGYSTSKEPREQKREAMLVAGFEVRDTMDQEEIMKVWMELMANYEKIETAIGDELLGITYFTDAYDPETETGYAYMAATQIKSEEGLPEGMVVRKVPPASYLVFEHTGSLQHLENSFNYIFQDFIPNSKRSMLYQDVLEIYGERYNAMNPEAEDSVIEIWIPVKELE